MAKLVSGRLRDPKRPRDWASGTICPVPLMREANVISTNDPRKPGGRYWSGYWQEEYTVEAMFSQIRPEIPGWGHSDGWMTVRWADGHTTTHCTAWDERRDRVLAGTNHT